MAAFFQKYKTNLIFLGLLLFMCLAYRYPHSTQMGPFSIHYWRQSSGTSLALNYEKERLGLFEPTIHWTGDGEVGKTVVEFPLIYYIVGKIWKLVGHHEFIFRLLNLLIMLTGLYYFYRFLKEYLKSGFWAVFLPLLLFTSPVLVYYGNNTLMNAPAFGLALIAGYYYWKFASSGRNVFLYVSMGIFTLSGLLRITSLILFASILMVHLLSLIPLVRKEFPKGERFRPEQLLPFAGVLILNLAWILWAKSYNQKNISDVMLLGLNPVWLTGLYDTLYIGNKFYVDLLGTIFSRPVLFLCFFLMLWMILNYRKVNIMLLSLSVFATAGSFAYFLLFFQAMTVHDYYLVNLVIVVPLTLITFIDYIDKNHHSLLSDRRFRAVAVVGLVLLLYGTLTEQRARYDTGDTFVKHNVILDRRKIDTYFSYQERYRNNFKTLESISPYLRELGIRREDKVISIPDETPNYTLYLMDQRGVTDYGYGHLNGAERIEHFIRHGARYLVINDPGMLGLEYLQPYLENRIGEYRNVSIYRLD